MDGRDASPGRFVAFRRDQVLLTAHSNAVAESFFATLKCELVYRHAWPTRARARSAIFEFIEAWYNRGRLHSSLGYMSPVDYERTRTPLKITAEEAA